jgi:GNAT superfamily N-acetyltransferase
MTTVVDIAATDRGRLVPLFSDCRYDRVHIDSVLEGHFGSAFADSASQPSVARLDSGAFTVLGGDPAATATKALLDHAPIQYVTPQNDDWRKLLERQFEGRFSRVPFTGFSWQAIDVARLAECFAVLPLPFELERIDKELAQRLPSDTGNAYFMECFASVDDFLARGIGFCVLHQDRLVSAATSMARSSQAIDIEIETVRDFRNQGLGTAVAARLVYHCLQHGIAPRWLAANAVSERLALRLGYVRGETYEAFEIIREPQSAHLPGSWDRSSGERCGRRTSSPLCVTTPYSFREGQAHTA